ncbi:MAG TPA: TipAS antibiotic-recognition domain-containing protein [Pseudonocardiaceae bacterium]|jgi:hypothetical protein
MDLSTHLDIAERRWGGTQQWRQVRERTAHYTDADWLAFREELSAIHLKILAAMRAGTPPTDPAVMDLVEQHRSHVSRWQYDCDHDTHRQLADIYLTTNRLARSYENMAPGLTLYMHEAMVANYERWVSRGSAQE